MRKSVIIIIIIAGIVSGFFIVKNIYSGGLSAPVFPHTIKLSGFQYDKDFNAISNAEITFKNIEIQALPADTSVNGEKKTEPFYSISCDVVVNTGKEEIPLHFKGSSRYLIKPEKINTELTLAQVQTLISGAFLKEENGKAKMIGDYYLDIAPDFSFADFLITKNGTGSMIYSYIQITNHNWIGVIPLRQFSHGETSDMNAGNVEAFFFSDAVTPAEYKKAADEGSFVTVMEKKLGRHPTGKEVEEYIKEKLSRP